MLYVNYYEFFRIYINHSNSTIISIWQCAAVCGSVWQCQRTAQLVCGRAALYVYMHKVLKSKDKVLKKRITVQGQWE
jgi:hypothetical protein